MCICVLKLNEILASMRNVISPTQAQVLFVVCPDVGDELNIEMLDVMLLFTQRSQYVQCFYALLVKALTKLRVFLRSLRGKSLISGS